MYRYPALDRNITTLRSFGVEVIPPGEGELASGLTGIGRMAEPEQIVEALHAHFSRRTSLEGRRVLVTAGPTHEPIDPVRYIANHSSGKMGYAIAEEARDRGARVTLVSGPTSLATPYGIETLHVTTASEMASAVEACRDDADIIIAAAAVADFTPAHPVDRKMKRREMDEEQMKIELQPTRDILRDAGERKREGQIIVGFALETASLLDAARAKLVEKHCDLVVANSALEEGAGFMHDTNRITLVTADDAQPLPMMTKRECAARIFDAVEQIIDNRQHAAVGNSAA
jgi:phosphopantothenoylcysteine decarboxylase/phosphopantothenate--cysteine ligase